MSERHCIEKNLEKYKSFQDEYLDYLEEEENIDNFEKLNRLFETTKIRDSPHELRLFLHMLVNINNNHHRGPNFFIKIERILQFFKDDIKKIPNTEIFNIFKTNKRILLSLIEEKVLIVDENFVKKITSEKYSEKGYPQYFAPEIKPFINKEWFPKYKWVEELKKELPNNFYELRNQGENDNYICQLIRKDSIVEFITEVNKRAISRNATINQSIYETNPFLIKMHVQSIKNVTLINYAAFYGSIQIFTYLKNEGVELTPSLWIYAIHSKNAELIHLLEDNHVEPVTIAKNEDIEEKSYKGCLIESIKCHHNDIANYLLDNYLQNKDQNSEDTIIQYLKYYNFSFIQNEHINEASFCYLCLYDYYYLVNDLLKNKYLNIISKVVHIWNISLNEVLN